MLLVGVLIIISSPVSFDSIIDITVWNTKENNELYVETYKHFLFFFLLFEAFSVWNINDDRYPNFVFYVETKPCFLGFCYVWKHI